MGTVLNGAMTRNLDSKRNITCHDSGRTVPSGAPTASQRQSGPRGQNFMGQVPIWNKCSTPRCPYTPAWAVGLLCDKKTHKQRGAFL